MSPLRADTGRGGSFSTTSSGRADAHTGRSRSGRFLLRAGEGQSSADPRNPTSAGVVSSASGSPLCQDAAGRAVLGSVVAGPGSDLFEEPVAGCEPVALDFLVAPECPPGLVIKRTASLTMCR